MKRLLRWWKEYRCEHYWRPARSVKKHLYFPNEISAYKVCDYCHKEVGITYPEFYAQFGRMPF